MRKQERQSYIRAQAYEMAKTGKHPHYRSIEVRLRASGYPEARQVLDNSLIRRELNALCKGENPYA